MHRMLSVQCPHARLLHAFLQGGPPEDITDSGAALDGWVEGPTWTSPLSASQLTALLVLMNAARELRLEA